ncbi:MAG: F0F1 ATP synthase subunit C [Candidatus Dadabacteria bacterium]|nr:F0F1 ATP synthase subunit C [Candidatus Dadabacteria bacterium]
MNKLFAFLSVMVFAVLAIVAPEAFAEEAASGGGGLDKMGLALGAGIGIGLAAGIAGIGQGLATAGALNGIARNPGAASKIQTPMIIGLALIESLVIYALAITFLLQAKI